MPDPAVIVPGLTPSRLHRLRRVAVQVLFLVVLVGIITWLGHNLAENLARLGVRTDYSFLRQPAGFDIAGSDFQASQTVGEALVVGARNTIAVSVAGIVLATMLGLAVGIARLSSIRLLRWVGMLFVEAFRNVPVLVTIVFMYLAVALHLPPIEHPLRPFGDVIVSNRGIWVPWPTPARAVKVLVVAGLLGLVAAKVVASWLGRRRLERNSGVSLLTGAGVLMLALVITWVASGAVISAPRLVGRAVSGGFRLQTEFVALLAGLVLYSSSHIAELVRASILAVPRGQSEAAEALGLSSLHRFNLIVVPQALRIMVPPLANLYLNIAKNSSLGVAIAFAELMSVTAIATASGSPSPQAISVLMVTYLGFSLLIAGATNLVNRRLLATWR